MRNRPVIAIICEERFQSVGGRLYTPNQFGDALWARYAAMLGPFAVIARVEKRAEPERGAAPVDPRHFDLRPLPSFQGPRELVPKLPRVLSALHNSLRDVDGAIVRCPGTVSVVSLPLLLARGKPIAIEMVGDPHAVFQGGRDIASRMIGSIQTLATRRMFAAASAVTYVTDSYLQTVYPPPPRAHAVGCSDVMLSASDLVGRPRSAGEFQTDPLRLLFGGSMEQNYKGLHILLEALALLRDRDRAVTLRIAGRGRHEGSLRAQANRLGLDGSVTMIGQLSNDELFDEIGRSDLFVLPSRTEGLPRIIIEAMARGLPVVASAVGGVPELLPARDLVPAGDAGALADRICECIDDPGRLPAMSAENLGNARRFAGPEIERKRAGFYEQFRATVERAVSAI